MRLLLAILLMAAVEGCRRPTPQLKPAPAPAPVEPLPAEPVAPSVLCTGREGSLVAELTPDGEAFWFGASRALRARTWSSAVAQRVLAQLEEGRAA